MKCMHKFFSCGAVIACAFALLACGDDVITQNTVQGFERVDEVSEVTCNAENEGKLVYETSSKTSYICSDKKWVDLDAVKSAASFCFTRTLDDKSGVEIVCGDSVVGSLSNGSVRTDKSEYSCKPKKSSDGRNIEIVCGGKSIGSIKNGSDGDCCSVKDVADEKTGATGYEITCGSGSDKTVGTVWNGVKGLVGEGCRITKEDGRVIEYTCGLEGNETVAEIYTGFCGGEPMNVKTQFCYDGEAYDYCDGVKFEPYHQYCKEKGSSDGLRDSVYESPILR